METINLTCISCPIGCLLSAEVEETRLGKVTGNLCNRGISYAEREITNPTRIMTSTVRLKNAAIAQLPVKTHNPIPKALVQDSVKAFASIEVEAPVRLGQIILANVCNTGVDVVATRSVPCRY